MHLLSDSSFFLASVSVWLCENLDKKIAKNKQ